MVTMYTSRGCPFHCIFCSYAKGRCRYRSPENIVAEIEHIVAKYNIKGVQFYDDTLTAKESRIMKICNLLIDKNIKISWGCYSRVDIVNEKLLRKMKDAGCKMISYGVESGSQRMLNIMKKGITLEKARRAVEMTRKVGIVCSASYVFGIPGETRKSLKETIQFAKKINSNFAHFNMITPWPGTDLYEEMTQNNKIKKEDWKNYYKKRGMHSPTISINGLSQSELGKLSKSAYRQFYLRPSKIFDLLTTRGSLQLLSRYIKSFYYLINLK
jgi:radical SAM superfamily enzyme YgiQ (UPF0313 family)